MPLAAVIIPVFNRNALLERAVASVAHQTMNDFECIIVDDGSDVPLPQTYGDRRFRGIRLEVHGGVSNARNRGVEATSAPLISFLDSDDEWLPKKLERQMHHLKKNPSCTILQCREIWIRNGVRVNPPATHEKKGGDIFEASLARCMITPSSVLMQRSLYQEHGGFNESLPACEDYDLWLRIAAHHPAGLVDDHLLIRYGGHDDQLSTTVPLLDRFRVRSMLQLLQHQTLNDQQRLLVQQQITIRATILANGFKKRGNHAASEQYTRIAATFGATATGTRLQTSFA